MVSGAIDGAVDGFMTGGIFSRAMQVGRAALNGFRYHFGKGRVEKVHRVIIPWIFGKIK